MVHLSCTPFFLEQGMKQVILGLAATLAIGSAAAAPQPTTLVRANGAVQVQVSGVANVAGQTVSEDSSFGAKAGDVVNVTNGTATVTYANGCTVKVDNTTSYTISAKVPNCHSPVTTASSDTKYYMMAGGAALLLGAGAGGGGGGDDKPSSP
jgi:hypothetical protein